MMTAPQRNAFAALLVRDASPSTASVATRKFFFSQLVVFAPAREAAIVRAKGGDSLRSPRRGARRVCPAHDRVSQATKARGGPHGYASPVGAEGALTRANHRRACDKAGRAHYMTKELSARHAICRPLAAWAGPLSQSARDLDISGTGINAKTAVEIIETLREGDLEGRARRSAYRRNHIRTGCPQRRQQTQRSKAAFIRLDTQFFGISRGEARLFLNGTHSRCVPRNAPLFGLTTLGARRRGMIRTDGLPRSARLCRRPA